MKERTAGMNGDEDNSVRRWTYRPARDLELGFHERLTSADREPDLSSGAVRGCWLGIVRRYLRIAHRLDVTGFSNLPADPPFVLIANHSSHLDAVILEAILPHALRNSVFAVAAGDAFFSSASRAVMSTLFINALPMWRRRRSNSHMLASLRDRVLHDPCGLILFPEGTRTRTGMMGAFKAGVGALVAETAVPVVPCALRGTYACWPAGRPLPRPGPISVAIGSPLQFPDVSNDRRGWMIVAEQCRDAVAKLLRSI